MNKLVTLFSVQTRTLQNLQQAILLAFISIIFSGCGGESTEGGLFQGNSDTNNPIQSPSEPGMPEPSASPSATPTNVPVISVTPSPTTVPGQEPVATPRPTQVPQTSLGTPSISTSLNANTLNVSWSNVNAAAYRLLVWQDETSAPIVVTTNNLNSSLALAAAGNYTIMVEAYDELGNSVFSQPSFMEVTQ